MRWFALLVTLVALGSTSGCLQIDTPDGALKCSSVPKRACPEGWYCLAGANTCWRDGHFPPDMAEPISIFPGGDEDMSVPLGDDMGGLDSGVPDDLTSNDDLLQTD
jgi:hypothetical protein